jgi:hypothetical protein
MALHGVSSSAGAISGVVGAPSQLRGTENHAAGAVQAVLGTVAMAGGHAADRTESTDAEVLTDDMLRQIKQDGKDKAIEGVHSNFVSQKSDFLKWSEPYTNQILQAAGLLTANATICLSAKWGSYRFIRDEKQVTHAELEKTLNALLNTQWNEVKRNAKLENR